MYSSCKGEVAFSPWKLMGYKPQRTERIMVIDVTNT